jgi:hypothetical protein
MKIDRQIKRLRKKFKLNVKHIFEIFELVKKLFFFF